MSADLLPAVVAIPWREYEHEPNPRLKLWGLCEVYEILVRFGVMLELAELRGLPDGETRLDAAIAAIGPGIEGPTLAGWLGMLAELSGRLARTDPLVLPELPAVAVALAALSPPAGATLSWDNSLLHLRNTLAHGGAVTTPMAERLLGGWDARLRQIIARLDFFATCRLVWWADGDVRRIAPDGRPGDVAPLSADLRVTLTAARLDRRVLLVRDDRCLDLWPLCDFAPASMSAFGTRATSSAPAPQVYFRAEKRRLLYAALGCDLPVHQSADHLAAFRAFFRLDTKADTPHAAADFATDIAGEAAAVCGRVEQLAALKKAVKETNCGVLWVSGPGGIGKSYLIAKFAHHTAGSNQFIPVFWRFRAGDADRCNRHAFFRHAVRTLSDPKCGLRPAAVFPSLDPSQLLPQFLDLLRDANARNDKRKVLFVLDGLDEIARSDADFVRSIADWHFGHAVWVCAGRHEGEVVPEVFADGRCRHVFPGGLPGLTPTEIRELIDARVGRRLRELLRHDEDAGDGVRNALVDAIAERAAGLPLYVHFVCEDLLSGQLPFDGTLPSRLPNKLEDYFEKLLKEAEADDEDAIPSPLIAVCAWALQPLDEDTLFELLVRREVLDRDEEQYSRDRLRRVLDRLGTIFRPVPRTDGRVGYEPYHLTFRDHIREDRSDRRRIQNRKAREVFCRITTGWQRLPTGGEARGYALRHGSEHLLREKRWDELAALARDEAYLTAQRNELPTDPAAAIRTVQHALTAVCEQDSGVGMAEAVLRLADRYEQMRQASPLDLLRAGNLDGAMSLADLQDPERRVLWYLLLAYDQRHRGHNEVVDGLINSLMRRTTPRVANEHTYAAIVLLASLAPALFPRWSDWCISQLDSIHLDTFLEKLIAEHGSWPHLAEVAVRIAEKIEDSLLRYLAMTTIAEVQAGRGDQPGATVTLGLATRLYEEVSEWHSWKPSDALSVLARGYAKSGNVEQSRSLFDKALQLAGQLSDTHSQYDPFDWRSYSNSQDGAIERIANSMAESGDFAGAIRTAERLSDGTQRARTLARIAEIQSNAGDVTGAASTLHHAVQAAQQIKVAWLKVSALCVVATAQANLAGTDSAAVTCSLCVASAIAIADPVERFKVLGRVARVQAEYGDVVGAIRMAEEVEGTTGRIHLLATVASVQMRGADLPAAGATLRLATDLVQLLETSDGRLEAVAEIAGVWAEGGDVTTALQLVAGIEGVWDRVAAFESVAKALASGGHADAAFRVAGAIEYATYRQQILYAVTAELAKSWPLTGLIRCVDAIEDAALQDEVTTAIAKARATTESLATESSTDATTLEDRIRELATGFGSEATEREPFAVADLLHQRIRSFPPPVSTYDAGQALTEIAGVLANNRRTDLIDALLRQAVVLSDKVEYDSQRCSLLIAIADAQSASGDADGATEMFRRATHVASLLEFIMTKVMMLLDISRGHEKAGHPTTAELTQQRALEAAETDPFARTHALSVIAQHRVKSGKTAEAVRMAEGIVDVSHRCQVIVAIANTMVQEGDRAGADEMLRYASRLTDRVNDNQNRSLSQTEIARLHGLNGDREAALDSLQNATRNADRIDDLIDRAVALAGIAEVQACSGDRAGGRALLERAIQSAPGEFREEWRRTSLCSQFAVAQVKVGFGSEALRTISSILVDPQTGSQPFVSALMEQGDRPLFKLYLQLAGRDIRTALHACGQLARLYPAEATAIAELLLARRPAGAGESTRPGGQFEGD